MKREHVQHKCTKENCYPCSAGLFLCDVCGGTEGSLTTECPGLISMSFEQHELIRYKKIDFYNGKWHKR